MALDLRSEIFQLRQQGVSQRGIASQLGISPAKVQRELKKRAPEVRAERAETGDEHGDPSGFGFQSAPGSLSPLDQLLYEDRHQVEREKLAFQRAQLRGQRLEAERRAQLLEAPDNGQGNNGMIALVLQAMDRMRDDQRTLLTQLASRQQSAVPAPPPPSLTEQLSQYRQMADTFAAFAPSKPPSSSVELEAKVAMERINAEERRLMAVAESEIAERRERLASENKRNETVALAIEKFGALVEQFAPTLIQRWMEQSQPAAPQLTAPEQAAGAPLKPVVVHADEVVGLCPNCSSQVAISGDQEERCPECGTTLAVAAGRIRARLPNGQLFPPLSATDS